MTRGRSRQTWSTARSSRSRRPAARSASSRSSTSSLDDSTAAAGKWDPGQTSSDARKAAQDPSTIVYLGEFNSGASAISIPILNEANVLQISPSNTYVGLTRSEGADKGEPDKYYPSGKRTFGRVVPADHIQAAAQVTYQKDTGCKKTYILNDKEVYGKGIAGSVQNIAKAQGLAIAGNDGIDTKAANFRSLATKIKSSGADCMFFGGIVQNKGVQLFSDVNAANPTMKLFGPDGMADPAFYTKASAAVAKMTLYHESDAGSEALSARCPGLLREVQAEVRQRPGAVRDLRLRGDEGGPAGHPERR